MAKSANLELSIQCIVLLWLVLTTFHTLGYFYYFTDEQRNPWQMLAEPPGTPVENYRATHSKQTTIWVLCGCQRQQDKQGSFWLKTPQLNCIANGVLTKPRPTKTGNNIWTQ